MTFGVVFEKLNTGFRTDFQQVIHGENGKDGADGYTPVRGVDYWTEADKLEIVVDVISALPVYNGEVV